MSAEADPASRRWPRVSFTRLLLLLAVGVVVTLGLLVAVPPTGILKEQLARDIGAAIGREVEIGGAKLDLMQLPILAAELSDVTVSNPPSMPGGHVFKAKKLSTRVALLPLAKGRLVIESLALAAPEFRLEESASGERNWILPVSGSGKGDTLRFPPSITVENGTLSFTSARTGASREATALDMTLTNEVSGAATAKGTMLAGGDKVAFDLEVANALAAMGGKTSAVKVAVDSPTLKAVLEGDALFAAAAEFDGKLDGSTGSLLDLARWLGFETEPGGSPIKAAINGKVKATTQAIAFDGTDVLLNGTSSRLDGRLDLGGPRPKLEGTIAAERIDLSRVTGSTARRPSLLPEAAAPTAAETIEVAPGWQQLLVDLAALENGTASRSAAPEAAAPSAAPAAASKGSAWSDEPINLKVAKVIDLDVVVTAKEIAAGKLAMKDGLIKTKLTDGLLDARLERVAIGDGKAWGTITLDSRATPPRASIVLDMTDVEAEPVISEITGKPLLQGRSNVSIIAKAAGQTQSQLAGTLEGKARFQMAKGAVRGFDVRRMISEWWRRFTFDLGMKTGFEKLEAQYDIKKGVARSEPDLAIGGGEVEINSVGDVNVPARRLNQEIRIKVVPPPTALPIPVRISGNWSKPDIGIDWGSLFSVSASALGGPQGVAPAVEAPPPAVEAAIRRVLAADLPPDRLSDEGRAMLRALLPPAPPEDAAPQ